MINMYLRSLPHQRPVVDDRCQACQDAGLKSSGRQKRRAFIPFFLDHISNLEGILLASIVMNRELANSST